MADPNTYTADSEDTEASDFSKSDDDSPARAHKAFQKSIAVYGGLGEAGPSNPPIAPNRKMQLPTPGPKNFIKGAIKRPGALHRALGVPIGKTIPKGKVAAAASQPGRLGRQARFAQTLGKLRT